MEAYTCSQCLRTSFNPHDVENLYCGNCHVSVRNILCDWHGYDVMLARQLPTTEIAWVARMYTTWGLFAGLGKFSYRTRYCYEKLGDALAALDAWDGTGDPPGPWIKQKPQDRLNPEWSQAHDLDSVGRRLKPGT